ncbi:MAG: 6-phosphofructokinase [Verrucomicrobia bacterium]|nr:6-phosphofructokinase [Verrucomicrobiota bacterium]
MATKRIGVLTGGGDCPGLNPVLVGIVRKALSLDYEVIGILKGWQGMIENVTMPLTRDKVSGILPRGGTILRTSRTNPYKKRESVEKLKANFKALALDALVAIGGDDTLGVAQRLYEQEGLPTVGVPKTIDNDLSGTDRTFGFDTAINIATEAIDRLHSTAESHDRVLVIELMGRHAGWITLYAGLAGGADVILIPEVPVGIEDVCQIIRDRHRYGRDFSIVAVSEGADLGEGMVLQEQKLDEFGHVRLGGIGERLSNEIEKRTGFETRFVVLGHLQRGGTPTAYDRYLGLRFGMTAVELIETGQFGTMVSLRGNDFVAVPLKDAVSKTRTVDPALYDKMRIFFG